MAEDQGKEEEKFDFTREGEAVGYISLAQARVLAMSTAQETPGQYGSDYRDVPMAFDTVEASEDEDFYNITLSFRPQGDFSGTPGQEQFFIEKEGTVAVRQVLRLPRTSGRFPLLTVAIGLVVVGVIVAVSAVFTLGSSGGGSVPVALVTPTETKTPTPAEVATPTLEPTLHTTDTPTPTLRPILTPTRRPILTPTPTPRPIPLPTRTQRPAATPNARSYFDKGEDYYDDGKYQLAINELTTAIWLNPQLEDAYYYRGIAYYNLGQYQLAVQDYGKAIQLDPDDAYAYNNSGLAYHQLGQYERAIEDYDKAIQVDPTDAWAYNNRGNAYGMAGQHSQRLADKAKACSLDSKYC